MDVQPKEQMIPNVNLDPGRRRILGGLMVLNFPMLSALFGTAAYYFAGQTVGAATVEGLVGGLAVTTAINYFVNRKTGYGQPQHRR